MNKVIKAFEEYVNNFKPCCTSDDVDLEMLRSVLSIVKDKEKPFSIVERISEIFDDYPTHEPYLPKAIIVTDNVLKDMRRETIKYYTIPSLFRGIPKIFGAYVSTVNDNSVLLISKDGNVSQYQLDEGRESE